MKELFKFQEHGGQQLIIARELHIFLQVQSKFADWIKNRIDKYGFIENQDFVTLSKNLENGGRTIEYGLTLDMAKELSMIENNDKGKQARQYFIQKEKELREVKTVKLPSRKELALMVVKAEEEIERLAITVKTQAPKAQYYDEVLQSESLITTTVIAKDLGMTAQKLNKILHDNKIIYNSNGTWVLYEKHQNKGYTQTKTHTFTDDHGIERTQIHTYWKEVGRQAVINFVKSLSVKTTTLI